MRHGYASFTPSGKRLCVYVCVFITLVLHLLLNDCVCVYVCVCVYYTITSLFLDYILLIITYILLYSIYILLYFNQSLPRLYRIIHYYISCYTLLLPYIPVTSLSQLLRADAIGRTFTKKCRVCVV